MTIKPEWTLGIIVATALFLGGLIYSQPDINMKHHRAYMDALNAIKHNMSMLESEVLHVRNGEHRFYDLIDYRMMELQRYADALAHPPAYLDKQTKSRIAEHLARGEENLEQIDILTNNFKRYFSLVRNSLSYLPMLAETLATRTAGNPLAQQNIFTVLQRVLVGTLSPDKLDLDRISQEKELLAQAELLGPNAEELNLYITHVDIVLEYERILNKVFGQLHNRTTLPGEFSAINKVYSSAYHQSMETVEQSLTILYWVSATLIVLVGLFMLQLRHDNRSLNKAIHEITAAAEAQARGDLTKRMGGEYRGQLSQLQEAFNKSISQMAFAVSQVIQVTTRVQQSACAIVKETEVLSSHSQEQTRHLEKAAGCMSKMSAQVEESSSNTCQANLLTTTARTQATSGQVVMKETIVAMEEIHESSTKMEEIITTIDNIAFQTNLLALNASVEAARSGEHGRGFAVVANEVRNLAGKSADAARDIKELIENSIARVASATSLAQHTGSALEELTGSIQQASQLMQSVTETIDAQAHGIQDVSQSVSGIESRMQGDNKRTALSAKLARDVQMQTAELAALMHRFKVEDTDTPGEKTTSTRQRSAAGSSDTHHDKRSAA